MVPLRRFVFLLPLTVALAGCATVAPFRGLAIAEKGVYVTGLPPIRQDERYACGAASVAAVAAYWNVPPDRFQSRFPQMKDGATGDDLQRLAEDLGLLAYVYAGSMDDLLENLRNGRPLIVMIPQPLLPSGGVTTVPLLNAWNLWGPKPAHWVIVVGLTENHVVILHDPQSGSLQVRQELFEKWWAQKGRMTVLIAAE